MRIIHTANELNPGGRKVCLGIGFFDGLHLGHQQLIRQTIADARQQEAIALIVTFDRHPNTVVAPNRVPRLIYSLAQKSRVISAMGPDVLLLIHFDRALSEQTGEQFTRALARDLGQIRSICVGAGFMFGYKRGGNVDLLKRLGAELKFTVHGVAAVSLDGRAVSSTRIRQAITSGNLDSASQMLGRPYSLSGKVVRGDGLGTSIGFPTANLDVDGLVLPPHGVYAAHVVVGGETRRAVLNIGVRPTLGKPQAEVRVETHLVDFHGDLYGQELEAVFGERLRDEKKFASITELRAQIAEDILHAQMRF